MLPLYYYASQPLRSSATQAATTRCGSSDGDFTVLAGFSHGSLILLSVDLVDELRRRFHTITTLDRFLAAGCHLETLAPAHVESLRSTWQLVWMSALRMTRVLPEKSSWPSQTRLAIELAQLDLVFLSMADSVHAVLSNNSSGDRWSITDKRSRVLCNQSQWMSKSRTRDRSAHFSALLVDRRHHGVFGVTTVRGDRQHGCLRIHADARMHSVARFVRSGRLFAVLLCGKHCQYLGTGSKHWSRNVFAQRLSTIGQLE